MQITFTHTLEMNGTEHNLIVEARYYPATPGTREDPPIDEEIVITSVMFPVTGHCMEILTDEEIETLEAAALEQVALEYEKYREAELEHRTNRYDFD